jgi:HK97 gp10 family phage protein
MFEIFGVDPVKKAFKRLEKNVARKVIRKALREAAKPVQADAKRRAPFDTGLLRKAIKVRAMRKKRGRIGIITITGQGDYKGDTFYGAFQEYGAQNTGRSRTANIPAKHYMKGAYDSKKDTARAIATSEILAGINRELSKP